VRMTLILIMYMDPETLDVCDAPLTTLDNLPCGKILRTEIVQHLYNNVH